MSYETFGDIKSFAMEMLSEEETEDVFAQRLLPRWAKSVRDQINEHHAWEWKSGEVRLTWSGTNERDISSVLYLPEDIGQILSMYPDLNSNYRAPVQILRRWEYDQTRPGSTRGRGRDYLVLWGYYRCKRDNPANAVLDIAATGGAAADGVEVRVQGRTVDNDQTSEVVTLDAAGMGQTVTVWLGGSRNDGVTSCEILPKSLEGKTGVGFVEFKNGGIEMERLNADMGQVARERRRSELYAQRGQGGVYSVAYYRRLPPLSSNHDRFLPAIPNEFNDVIENGIMSWICRFRKERELANDYKLEFQYRLRALVAWDNRSPGYRPHVRVNRQFGSRIGQLR